MIRTSVRIAVAGPSRHEETSRSEHAQQLHLRASGMSAIRRGLSRRACARALTHHLADAGASHAPVNRPARSSSKIAPSGGARFVGWPSSCESATNRGSPFREPESW